LIVRTAIVGLDAAMRGTRLRKTSRRNEIVRDPRQVETNKRPRRDGSTSRDHLEIETSRLRPLPCQIATKPAKSNCEAPID